MSFLSVTGEHLEVTGINGEKYQLKAASVRVWRNFCIWVQYKPYRDSIIACLPDNKKEEIYKQCLSGKVTELTVPEDWPKDKKPEEKDLIEREININPFSTVVLAKIGSSEGDEKLIELAFWDQYPKLNQKPLHEFISVEKQEFLKFRQEYAFVNGFCSKEELEEKIKEDPLLQNPNEV